MTVTETQTRQKHPLVNGKPIHFRWLQMLLWSVAVAACAAALVAGMYFNILEVAWRIMIGPVHLHIFYLKHGWDDLVHNPSWTYFRHGYRNDGEPALATIIVLSFLAKPKMWSKKCGPIRLALSPLLLVAAAFVLITGAVWLQYFGLPDAWAHIAAAVGHRGYHAPLNATEMKLGAVLETVLFGFIIGRVLHIIWQPVGAHIQGAFVDRAVDRYWKKGGGTLPAAIRYPLLPPVVRERFAEIVAEDQASGEAATMMKQHHTPAKRGVLHGVMRVLYVVGMILVAYFVVTGFIAHFWIGTGHSFPYLAPAAHTAHTVAHTALRLFTFIIH
jgi:hypothetical protein